MAPPLAVEELLSLSALDLAAKIRARELSSVEATQFFLTRIARFNPELNAFVDIHTRRALRRAEAIDRRLASDDGTTRPLFLGVPTAIKDLTPMAGSFTRAGSRAYRWFISPFSTPIVGRVQRGGFVILGKLATSEFGAMPITEPDIHPPTRNPWDRARTPGGSSGGSASAVAAGLLPIAQGSDGGGSVRIPSAFCHLFGFKPSLDLIGNMHGRVNVLRMGVMGPLAHTVEDGAAMLDVFRDRPLPDDRDETSCLTACRKKVRRLRIGFSTTSPLGGPVTPEIARATEDTAQLLASLGHDVEPFEMERAEIESFLPLWQVMLRAVPSPSERLLQPITRWLRAEGRKLKLENVRLIQAQLEARMERMFTGRDVVLTPTVPVPAPPIGYVQPGDPRDMFFSIGELAAFTAIYNATDRPAASLPAGVTKEGWPYAIQLGGRRGDDQLLLALSKQLEEARPWRHRKSVAR